MQENISRIEQQHQLFKNRMERYANVENVRVLGTIFAFEIKRENTESYYGDFRNKAYAFFIENGIILRPVGNTIYIIPPYVTGNEQLEIIYKTIEKALEIL